MSQDQSSEERFLELLVEVSDMTLHEAMKSMALSEVVRHPVLSDAYNNLSYRVKKELKKARERWFNKLDVDYASSDIEAAGRMVIAQCIQEARQASRLAGLVREIGTGLVARVCEFLVRDQITEQMYLAAEYRKLLHKARTLGLPCINVIALQHFDISPNTIRQMQRAYAIETASPKTVTHAVRNEFGHVVEPRGDGKRRKPLNDGEIQCVEMNSGRRS